MSLDTQLALCSPSKVPSATPRFRTHGSCSSGWRRMDTIVPSPPRAVGGSSFSSNPSSSTKLAACAHSSSAASNAGAGSHSDAMWTPTTTFFSYVVKSSQVKSSAGNLGERDAPPTGPELPGRGAYVPLFLSPNPPLIMSDAGRSRADFLSGVRVALIGSRSARYFSATSSPRARWSAPNDVSPLDGKPLSVTSAHS